MAYKIISNFTDASGATRYLIEIEEGNNVYFKFRDKISEEDIQKVVEQYVANLEPVVEETDPEELAIQEKAEEEIAQIRAEAEQAEQAVMERVSNEITSLRISKIEPIKDIKPIIEEPIEEVKP
jgi:DNA-binding transcriptional regulator GbsR (MarR family)